MLNRSILRLAFLSAGVAALAGCQSLRDSAGLAKQSPDEFAVATKAPLIIPPDFNLRPPRDGAPPTNMVAPTDAAQEALYPTDANAAAANIKGDYSTAERQLLAQTNAANADPAIRQQIATDGRAMEASNDSFTNQVLFWQDKKDGATPVDADAESQRLSALKAYNTPTKPAAAGAVPAGSPPAGATASAAGSPLAAGTEPAPAATPPAPAAPATPDVTDDKKPADSATIKKDDSGGGWLDGIF